MDSYIQYKKFLGAHVKQSLNLSSCKLDDQLNKSAYQDDYIDRFLKHVQKQPHEPNMSILVTKPPLLLLRNKKYHNQSHTPSKDIKINQKETSSSSVVQDYIEMKMRQQILEVYQNESKIVDSAKQKMKKQPQRQYLQNQQSFQNSYIGNLQNKNNQSINKTINSMANNNNNNNKASSHSFIQESNGEGNQLYDRPLLTEQSDQVYKSPIKQIKCFRNLHKQLHNSLAQQSQATLDFYSADDKSQNQERKTDQQKGEEVVVSLAIKKSEQLFNNSALTQLIKPFNHLIKSKHDLLYSNKQLENHTLPVDTFFFEKRQKLIPSLQKKESSDSLFDIRSTHILKESAQTQDCQQKLSIQDLYGNNGFCQQKRHLRSFSQREEQKSQQHISFPHKSSRRYNIVSEEKNNQNLSQESINQGSNYHYQDKSRKQTISKLITYFNTIADFKQESREQILKNKISSRQFLSSQNKNLQYHNVSLQSINLQSSQILTPDNEEDKSPGTNSLTPFQSEQKNKSVKHLDLSPLITDFSIEKGELKSIGFEDISDSIYISQSSSNFTSRTTSPAIRPKYFLDNDNEINRKSFTINARPTKRNKNSESLSTQFINAKTKKLINSASVASKDKNKCLKSDDNQQQIFMNKSFFLNRQPQKFKLKKSNLINQSFEIDVPKKLQQQQKKEYQNAKLNAVDSKQNSNNYIISQLATNQSFTYTAKNIKTINQINQ